MYVPNMNTNCTYTVFIKEPHIPIMGGKGLSVRLVRFRQGYSLLCGCLQYLYQEDNV